MERTKRQVNKLGPSSTVDELEVSFGVEKPEVSLVMPAYNEGDMIEEVVERVDRVVGKTGLSYELIVVDDGSLDDTQRKLMNYAQNNGHVRVVGYAKNMGKGHAVTTGFACAKGDVVVFIDSDSDINPSQICRYVEAVKQADIVIASKWLPQSKVDVPLIRKILSYVFNVLVKLLTGIRLSDTQTGLKAVRRKAVEKVFSKLAVKRYAFDVELLGMANLHGLRVVELPVTLKIECLFSLREVWRMFVDLLGITYRLKLLKWYKHESRAQK